MLSRSATYNSIMSGWHSVEWKIVIDGTTYGMGDISADLGGGHSLPKLNRCLFTGSTPTIGGCCAATFECSIFEESANIPRMATVVPSYRISNGTLTSEWIQLGVFYIDTRSYDKVTGALSLYCYDAMLKADGINGQTYAELSSFDEWPQSMADVVDEIADIMGVDVDSRTSIHTGTGYMVQYPNDLTMREVLGYIAVAHVGNWCITPDNKLRLIPITGGNGSLNLGSNAVVLKSSDELAAYTGVTVYYDDESAYDAGTDFGMTIVADCPWATQDTATGMLSDISGYQYQPYTIQGAFPDLALELGDSVTAGLPNDTVTGPCFSINITCEVLETAEISAPGEAEVDHEYPYVDYVDRNLKRRVGLGQPYYGVTISRRMGIEIKRSDGASQAIFNSDRFEMDALIDGVMTPRIYFDPVKGDYVFDGALGADAVFTDSLYAEQGDIAELTVDRLSTSRRIRKYILGDTSDDNYIKIQDQYIRWITGTIISSTGILTEDGLNLLTESGLVLTEEVGSAATEQATNRWGQGLYWQREPVGHTADGYPTDADGTQIYATTTQTIWPVVVYQYTELVKSEYAFDQVGQNYVPQVVLGAGDENGNSKGYLYKDESGLLMRYVSSRGKNVDISYSDDGFVDAMHRRLNSLIIDSGSNAIVYTVEGDNHLYSLTYSIDGDTITFTWPDGYTCDINIPDDPGGGGGGGGGSSPAPSSSNPIMDGTASPGVATTYARGDHVHPTDTSRVPTSRTINGQALSGNVTLDANDVGAIPSADKGVAGGVAELDADGVVPSGQLDLSGKQDSITASGILKGDGAGGISAAVAGTDYQAPLVAGTDYATPAQIPSVPSISTSTPQMDGTAAAGSTGDVSDAGHVHPSDTSKANQEQLAYVESGSTASQAYAAGDYFCWNGLLYRAKTAINSGASFTVGTNCEAVTVGAELYSSVNYASANASISSVTGSIIRVGVNYIINLAIVVDATINRFVGLVEFSAPLTARTPVTYPAVWVLNHQAGSTQYAGFVSFASNKHQIFSSTQLPAGTYSMFAVVTIE